MIVFVCLMYCFVMCDVIMLYELVGELLLMCELGLMMCCVFEDVMVVVGLMLCIVMDIGSCEVLCEVVMCGFGVGMVLKVEYVFDEWLWLLCIDGDLVEIYIYVCCLSEWCGSWLVVLFFDVVVWCWLFDV